jgi:hypothetical protein
MSTSAVIESTLRACEGSLAEIRRITTANFAERDRYAREYTAWTTLSRTREIQRNTHVTNMVNKYNREKNAKNYGQQVWAGNNRYNCGSIGELSWPNCGGPLPGYCGYCKGFGEKGEAKQRCQACYGNQCSCPSKLEGVCYNGCQRHYYINDNWKPAYFTNRYTDANRYYPAPQPVRPAAFIPIPQNVVCAACQQSVSIGSISASSVSLAPVNQTMSCLSGLQGQLSAAKTAEQQAAQAAADTAAAAALAASLRALQLAKEKAQQEGIPDPRFPETVTIANAFWRKKEIAAAIDMIQKAAAVKRRELEEQEKYANDVEEVKRIRKQLADNHTEEMAEVKATRERITAKFTDDKTKAIAEYEAAKKQKMMILLVILVFIIAAVVSAGYFYKAAPAYAPPLLA